MTSLSIVYQFPIMFVLSLKSTPPEMSVAFHVIVTYLFDVIL